MSEGPTPPIDASASSPGTPTDSPSDAAPDLGSPVADSVYRVLAPSIASLGVELIDVEWTGGTLRLTIDGEAGADADEDGGPGDGMNRGVTTGQLAEVNRLVSPLLDQHDPVPGRYLLEVSSPGVERPLRRPDHFRRAVGEQVIVKMQPGSDPRRVRGQLTAVDDETVTVMAVEVDGVDLHQAETISISHGEIAKARTHFDWGPTPKKGGGQPRSKKNQSKKKSSNNKRKKR